MSLVIMESDPRQRMIETAAVVMRERGVEATSFSEVIARSGAPRGSIYHHFPGGKAQLIEEATRYAGEYTAASIANALWQDDPTAAIRAATGTWLKLLRRSDFGAGCPVVAASLDATQPSGAREAAGEAFSRWQQALAEALEPHGLKPERARSLAALIISSIEGAVVLSRATRSLEPLERVAAELEGLIAGAISR
jgi:AcrR family transcriptional regulator